MSDSFFSMASSRNFAIRFFKEKKEKEKHTEHCRRARRRQEQQSDDEGEEREHCAAHPKKRYRGVARGGEEEGKEEAVDGKKRRKEVEAG